jgi:hypothetical protein
MSSRNCLHKIYISILVFFIFGLAEALSRPICLETVQNGLINGSISPNNATIFFRDRNGVLQSSTENPILTLAGCREFCGRQRDWYPDAIPRINTWLLPVFLIIQNMEVSPLETRRYLMIIHLIGDPIDSLWSLLAKVDTWSRIHELAASRGNLEAWDFDGVSGIKIIATLLAGREEVSGPDAKLLRFFDALTAQPVSQELLSLVQKTAFKLADSRSDEIIRTLFAISLYIWQLVAAFVATLGGGNTSPPGGRIGTAMFITWLVPAVLLSNAIGGFHSRTACFQIMADFDREAMSYELGGLQSNSYKRHLRLLNKNRYLDGQNWRGGVYSYRQPKSSNFDGRKNNWRSLQSLLLAFAPIIVGAVFGSAILWETQPRGMNCRNIMLIVMTIVWMLSPLATWAFTKVCTPRDAWTFVMLKDMVIALLSLLMVFLSSAGLYNSCYCWSGIFSLGANANTPLNTDGIFTFDDTHLYVYLTIACMALQVSIFICMVLVGWKGFAIMRWGEAEKRDIFTRFF